MVQVRVLLDSIDKVRDFVSTLTKFKTQVDMKRDGDNIDARSILGLFSIDLSAPVDIVIYDSDETQDILKAIESFII